MAQIDFSAEIRALRATYTSIENVSNVEELKEDIAELSERAGEPNLWDDPAAAQVITSRLSHRQTELERLNKLASRIDDLEVLVELGQDEGD
ncbi:MAG: bacterial peptide chain release factor 2 (bRF-2), partial [Arthrobacter sp.]|nr:bacterial peptide chain release factor 2 (bRF-2) [Arthrobacter sp.]